MGNILADTVRNLELNDAALAKLDEIRGRKNSLNSPDSPGVPSPEPLRRPTPAPKPYPVEDLGPILGPACHSLTRVIQAPVAVCAASLLAAASLATQALADIQIDGRVILLTLWLLTVAESGERKSANDAAVMKGVREVEHSFHDDYQLQQAETAAKTEEWKARREAAKTDRRAAHGVGLAAALQVLGGAPEPPLLPFLTIADFTAEGLAKLLRDGRPSVGAFTDEGGVVFGGHGMTDEAVTRTAATFSKLWDRGELDRIRSMDGATKLYGRRVALHLLVQPVIAEKALSNAILSGQGFLARCLLAWPEGTAGTRAYVAEDLDQDPDLQLFVSRTKELLTRDLPLADQKRNELSPRALTLSPDAKTLWVEIYNTIESDEAPGKPFDSCKIWASKAAEQILRIAGVMTLIPDPEAQQISVDTIRHASALMSWYLAEAARLAGTAEVSQATLNAEALLNWCHEKGREFVYSSVVLNGGPRRIRERSRFLEAVHQLESAGWAFPIDGGMVLDEAKRAHAWRILPASAEAQT